MSQMFCMRLGSRALRASLCFKCSNMCSRPDVHLSCVQRHINTCVLFHPRGRYSALVEPFKPCEWCTSENKYRCLFVKAAQVNVGRWIQKSFCSEPESWATELCVTRSPTSMCFCSLFNKKKSINAQNRCVQLSVLHKGRVLSNKRREKWHLTATIKVAIKLHLFISNTSCCLRAKIVKAASLSRCLGSYVCRGLNIE